VFNFSLTYRSVNTDFFFNFSNIFLILPMSNPSDFLLNRRCNNVAPVTNLCLASKRAFRVLLLELAKLRCACCIIQIYQGKRQSLRYGNFFITYHYTNIPRKKVKFEVQQKLSHNIIQIYQEKRSS
jgi:hypothetical protein